MIKFIGVDDVLAVRSLVLREGKTQPEECRFDTDNIDGAFHLGYYVDDELASIASFHPQNYGTYTGMGYQLRGMATIEKLRSQGLGTKLVNFAVVYLRGQKANYLWCNARKKALTFYQSSGFEIISDEFEGYGKIPHYAMYLKIN